jgi:hypothetical protein
LLKSTLDINIQKSLKSCYVCNWQD